MVQITGQLRRYSKCTLLIRERLLFKNAHRKQIKARIAANLGNNTGGTLQEKTDFLMSIVLEAVQTHMPKLDHRRMQNDGGQPTSRS